jgi:hypothetical protein
MWCDQLPADTSWTILWRGLIICDRCSGIRRIDSICPVCRDPIPHFKEQVVHIENGSKARAPAIFMGAEGRFEDYVYLKMIEREWKRPILEKDQFLEITAAERPSPRAAIVLLFWTYFETRIERLLRSGMRSVPSNLAEDTLRRYSFIGVRLDRLYRIIFETTYSADLNELGYTQISTHLAKIQRRRNDFSHGDPKAIDDALVTSVVENLKIEHEAWIAVFNKRTARH